MEQHLRRHGCNASRLVIDRDTDIPTGDIIRRHVDLLGADMVVMGFYGHSRLREFILGGVSREILSELAMPVLVSH